MGDSGEYTCVVSNIYGDRQNSSAYLNVECKIHFFTIHQNSFHSVQSPIHRFLSYWYVLTYNKCTDIKCNLKLDCKCIISDKAKVIYAPKEVYLPYGKQALLDCHFRANPPLTDLRWEKDGFLFDPYNVQGVFYRKNGSLYFSKVDETHAGSYTCTPYNELGTEGPSSPTIVVTTQLRSRKIVRQIGRPETIS